MRILSALSDLMVPVLIFYVVGLGLLMKQDVFGDFLNGAKDGMRTVIGIVPTLIGLMAAVGVLRSSGFLEDFGKLLGTVLFGPDTNLSAQFCGSQYGVRPEIRREVCYL